MDMSLVVSFLLLAVLTSCYGNIANNCTTYPTFTDYDDPSTAYHCYMYALPPVFVDKEVVMTVNVTGDNVTLIWYTEEDGVINCDPFSKRYLCGQGNKTLLWRSADGNKVFYVNATNNCGGNATACFKVKPLCHSCVDDCRHIPGPTNSSVEVVEHSKHTFDFTIKGTKDIPLQWCYHGTDNYSACCVCNDPQSNDPQSKCQVKDWTTDLYSNKCNHYSCVLTIHNISMNYSNGMLVSTAVVSDNDTKNINYTRIFVTQDSSTHKSQPVTLYYIVVVMGIIAATIVTVTCGIFVIKRTYRWSRSYYLHHDYEAIKSPTAVQREMIEDFSDDNEDVTSRDLDITDVHVPRHV